MPEFEFAVIFSEGLMLTEELENKIYGGGCDDAQLGSIDGRIMVDFSREADSFADAVLGALADLKAVGLESEILQISPGDLVSQVAIGKRLSRSRQQIHQYVSGQRGPGEFPKPIEYAEERKPVWSWASVMKWFANHELMGVQQSAAKTAKEIEVLNSLLKIRALKEKATQVFYETESKYHDTLCTEGDSLSFDHNIEFCPQPNGHYSFPSPYSSQRDDDKALTV